MNAIDILHILKPSNTLKVANKAVHEISFDDVFHALAAMKRTDLSDAIIWTNLCTHLFGNNNVDSWKGDTTTVSEAVLAQRKK
jgi:hypothetical protein